MTPGFSARHASMGRFARYMRRRGRAWDGGFWRVRARAKRPAYGWAPDVMPGDHFQLLVAGEPWTVGVVA